jgi:hypothetical protein
MLNNYLRWKNTLFFPFSAGLVSCAVLLIQFTLAIWRKRREDASSEPNIRIVKSESRVYTGRFSKLSKVADKHGGLLILACKAERFLGSVGLLGLSLYDLINEGNSRDFVGGISVISTSLPQLSLVVAYVSYLSPSIV